MGILVALFIFGQTYADTTWTMYGGTFENTHCQKMVGAMETAPDVKWSYVTGDPVESYGAAVANVDGIAGTEVVIGSGDGKVYCLNGTTGAVKWSYATGDGVRSSPSIADVDGIAGMEVVVGSYDDKVYCLDGVTGTVKWSYVTGDLVCASPVVADVDGIAGMEVVVGGYDKKVYCLDGVSGALKWSYTTNSFVYSSPAVANVDGIAGMEILVGSSDRKVYCLDGATGVVKWAYDTGSMIWAPPAVADLDGSGTMEIVIGVLLSKVYCLNGVDGTVKWSYQTGLGDWVSSSPAIADLDGNGTIEVVIGSNDNKVYCLAGATGGLEWSYNAGGDVHRGISVADLDGEVSGECKLEVLVPNVFADYLICLNGEDGSVLWTKSGLGEDVHDITIADIDDDGCVELVVGTLGDNKIWALDDVGDSSDCMCDSSNDIEESNARTPQNGIEFRSMGKGVYLFTPNAVQVDINVYDVSGSLEQTIYKGVLSKGGHTFIPNIKSSGVYFITLQSHNFKQSLKMIRF